MARQEAHWSTRLIRIHKLFESRPFIRFEGDRTLSQLVVWFALIRHLKLKGELRAPHLCGQDSWTNSLRSPMRWTVEWNARIAFAQRLVYEAIERGDANAARTWCGK